MLLPHHVPYNSVYWLILKFQVHNWFYYSKRHYRIWTVYRPGKYPCYFLACQSCIITFRCLSTSYPLVVLHPVWVLSGSLVFAEDVSMLPLVPHWNSLHHRTPEPSIVVSLDSMLIPPSSELLSTSRPLHMLALQFGTLLYLPDSFNLVVNFSSCPQRNLSWSPHWDWTCC